MLTKEIRKRGRPTLGDRPLTVAEKQARYRAAARRKGKRRVFEITLEGDVRRKVEEIATILEIPAARALRLCAEAGMGDMWLTALNVRDLMKSDPAERRARKTLSDLKTILEGAGVDTSDIDRATVGLPVDCDVDKAIDLLAASEDDVSKAIAEMLEPLTTPKGGHKAG